MREQFRLRAEERLVFRGRGLPMNGELSLIWKQFLALVADKLKV